MDHQALSRLIKKAVSWRAESDLRRKKNAALVAAANGAALRLGVQLLQHYSKPGAFVSPQSLQLALALVLNGAGPGSQTHAQLLALLAGGNHGLGTEGALNRALAKALACVKKACLLRKQLVVASSLWAGRSELNPGFASAMDRLFQAVARRGGAADVNAWVADATKGLIQELLSVSDQPFDLVLTTAAHFRGQWKNRFDRLSAGVFTTSKGRSCEATFMKGEFKHDAGVRVVTCPGRFKGVLLPYQGGVKGDCCYALALLPEEGPGRGPLDALAALADRGPELEVHTHEMTAVDLPKFSANSYLALKGALEAMGIQDAFVPGTADFSRSVAPGAQVGRLFIASAITNVVHKAMVEVDEEGLPATDTAGHPPQATSPAPPRDVVRLVFNRPFAFVVMWAGEGGPAGLGGRGAPVKGPLPGLPLFMGSVENPLACWCHNTMVPL